MEARPKIKIGLSRVDKFLEIICIAILVIVWVCTIAFFPTLPSQVPSHYNAVGQVDDFSNKTHIFFVPTIATIIYIGLTILNKYPHIYYKYPAVVTSENAKRLYIAGSRLVRVIKLFTIIIFSAIVFITISTALSNSTGAGAWFLPAVIILMTAPVIFFMIKFQKQKQTNL